MTFTTISKYLLIGCLSIGTTLPQISCAKKNMTSIEFSDLLQQERLWAGLTSKQLKVGEITWHYSEGGAQHKPTLILIHGLSGTRDNWNRVAHYLTPHYRVIIPDLPFHGDTMSPQDFDSSVPNLTEKLRRFAEALNVNKDLNIAGHSLGGAIALLYSAQYSTDTKSMLLMNAAGVYKSANTPYLKDPQQLKQLLVTKSGDLDRLLKLTMSNPPFIPHQIYKLQENSMINQSKNTQKVIDQLILIQKAYTPDSFALATRVIDFPVMIIWGDQDKIINKEASHELKSLLKYADEPIIYSGVGHMPLLELDQIVAKDYLKFLNKVQSAAPKP